jgi:hypothetical protein
MSARGSSASQRVADVLVARAVPTADGRKVVFDELWQRRRSVEIDPGVAIALPAIDDVILTRRIAPRPIDLEDIRLLELLRSRGRTCCGLASTIPAWPSSFGRRRSGV